MARAIKVTDNTKIRVESFIDKDGGRHLNVRKFYKTKNDDTWKPARQGITVSEELAAKFIKALKGELDEIEDNAKPLENQNEDSKPAKSSKATAKSNAASKGKSKRKGRFDD